MRYRITFEDRNGRRCNSTILARNENDAIFKMKILEVGCRGVSRVVSVKSVGFNL